MKRCLHYNIPSNSGGKYLKSWVYGGLDGIVTTFAAVGELLSNVV